MSHDVNITEHGDKAYCSFVFGINYLRVFVGENGHPKVMSELITRENLLKLKYAIESHLYATDDEDDYECCRCDTCNIPCQTIRPGKCQPNCSCHLD